MGKSLASRARFARVRAGYAKESDAAKVIGCSRPLVIRWENGEAASIGGKYLLSAARAYHVRPEWLTLETADDGYPWSPAKENSESLSSTAPNGEIFTPPSSHLLRPDPAIVRRANLFLTLKFAEANIDDLLFDLDLHAELFSLAYEWVSNPANKDVLAELTHAINQALDGGGGDGGGKRAGTGVRRGKHAGGASA